MTAYAKMLLSQRGAQRAQLKQAGGEKRADRRSSAELRKALAPLRGEVSTCEARIEKLETMREEIERRLADPALYGGAPEKLEALTKKRAEILDGIARAEQLWESAVARLDAETERLGG